MNTPCDFDEAMSIQCSVPSPPAESPTAPATAPITFNVYTPDFSSLDEPADAGVTGELEPISAGDASFVSLFTDLERAPLAVLPVVADEQAAIIESTDGVFRIAADVAPSPRVAVDTAFMQLVNSVLH